MNTFTFLSFTRQGGGGMYFVFQKLLTMFLDVTICSLSFSPPSKRKKKNRLPMKGK